METVTRELARTTDFSIPLAIAESLDLPGPASGCYVILVWPEGTVSLAQCGNEATYEGPAVLCLSPAALGALVVTPLRMDGALPCRGYTVCITPEGLASSFVSLPKTFEYVALSRFDQGLTYRQLSADTMRRMLDICASMHSHLNLDQEPSWPCLARSYALELLVLIDRSSYLPGNAQSEAKRKEERILSYLHEAYSEELSVSSIARVFATNRTSLNLLFRKAYGMSVMACVTKIRIEVASSFLRNTELTVREISLRTGYRDESYFSRAFKGRMGCSPVEYRSGSPNPYEGS